MKAGGLPALVMRPLSRQPRATRRAHARSTTKRSRRCCQTRSIRDSRPSRWRS